MTFCAQATSADKNGSDTRLNSKFLILYGERGRNRTYNLLIKSQLLCQLSYAPAREIWHLAPLAQAPKNSIANRVRLSPGAHLNPFSQEPAVHGNRLPRDE